MLLEERKKELAEVQKKIKELQKRRKFLRNYISITEIRIKKRAV